MEFLARGALEYNEPGVFMSFEETEADLTENFASLGFDLPSIMKEGKIQIDYVHIECSEIKETGEYDLEGLFIRLGYAIDTIGAKRVVLDTIEALFGGFSGENILRAELRRLFKWLRERGVTAIITGERGINTLTRYGLEEYIADCVIFLDHRVMDQTSTRRLRIVKYRGSTHGTSEYPFLINTLGIWILPITSLGLEHTVSTERIPTGIPQLDGMMEGKGYYRGSSILVTGVAGTGKSTISASFVDAACRRGEKCLYFAFEESQEQIIRNMRSVGIDLDQWVKKGLLRFHATRVSRCGIEMHIVEVIHLADEFTPSAVVIDPISNLVTVAEPIEVKSALTRITDHMKLNHITCLTQGGESAERTDSHISSIMDTWILLQNIEYRGERNRGIYILKSRGMKHSNQIREFVMTDRGIELVDVYVGTEGVLMGSARVALALREKSDLLDLAGKLEGRTREIERKRRLMESQVEALRARFEAEEEELKQLTAQEKKGQEALQEGRMEIGRIRGADGGRGKDRGKS